MNPLGSFLLFTALFALNVTAQVGHPIPNCREPGEECNALVGCCSGYSCLGGQKAVLGSRTGDTCQCADNRQACGDGRDGNPPVCCEGFTCTQQRNGKPKVCLFTGYKIHEPTAFHCPETLKSDTRSGKDWKFTSKELGKRQFACRYNRLNKDGDDDPEICTYNSKTGKYVGNAQAGPCPEQLDYMCPQSRKLKYGGVEEYSSKNVYSDTDHLACWYKGSNSACNYYKADGKLKRGPEGCPASLVP